MRPTNSQSVIPRRVVCHPPSPSGRSNPDASGPPLDRSRAQAALRASFGGGVPPGRGAQSAHVDLTYDPRVLAAIAPAGSGGGRVTLDLTGSSGVAAQVRFKVIAESPTSTQIGIENATAVDARGASVAIAAPAAHDVAIVQAQKVN